MSDPYDMALQAFESRDLVRARMLCDEGQRANPFDGRFMDLSAMIHLQQGQPDAALAQVNNAISLEGGNSDYHAHKGMIMKALDRMEDARQAYEAAVELAPNSVLAHYNLAILLREMRDFETALTHNKLAAELAPDFDRALNNLGISYQELGYFDEAKDAYRKCLAVNPGHVGATAHLISVLAQDDDLVAAAALAKEALQKWPEEPELLNILSFTLLRSGDRAGARQAVDDAIRLAPDFAQARYARAMMSLAEEDFEAGWQDFEWRVKRPNFWPKRRYDAVLWDGAPFAGKTLLVHWEQGFGDILQFARYLPILRREMKSWPGGETNRILFDCPKKLMDLFDGLDGIDEIGDFGDAPPPIDLYAPVMGLPLRLPSVKEATPADTPYIANTLTEYFHVPAPAAGSLKVGLTWASDHGDQYRNKVCTIDDLRPLFGLENVSLYGLQFGAPAEELAPYVNNETVFNLADDLGDFVHTATVVDQMDLILSIDTYIVHLAGAMNKPCWVMLPFAADWRWFLDRDDSPWYPNTRLFRQPTAGDWAGVVTGVQHALVELASGA